MAFCNNCGYELSNSDKYCPNCGAKNENDEDVTDETVNNIDNIDDEDDGEGYKDDEETNKALVKFLIPIFIIFVVFLISFAGIYYYNTLHSAEKTITNFKSAVMNNDYNKLSNVVTSSDTSISVNEASLKPLVTYLNTSDNNMNYVIGLLETSINEDSDSMFKVIEGRKYFILKTHYVDINTVPVTINYKVKDATLTFNDVRISPSTVDNTLIKINNVFPGIYEYTSKIDNDFINKNESYEAEITDPASNTIEVFPNLYTVKIKSDIDNGTVFVNGKNTGVSIGNEALIGPFEDSVTLKVSNGSKSTKTVTASPSQNEFILYSDGSQKTISSNNSQNDQGAMNKVSAMMNNYLENFDDAVNTQNFELISKYLKPGSELYNMQQQFISESAAKGIKESFIGATDLKIQFTNSTQTDGTITVTESYQITQNEYSNISKLTWHYNFAFNKVINAYQLTKIYE